MAQYQIRESGNYLGESWGGCFASAVPNYPVARTLMTNRFMEYLREYKNVNPKVTITRNACRMNMDDGDYVEVLIEEDSAYANNY